MLKELIKFAKIYRFLHDLENIKSSFFQKLPDEGKNDFFLTFFLMFLAKIGTKRQIEGFGL